MTVFPTTTDQACSLHRFHRPAPDQVNEFHHIIPQAWQHFWKPPATIFAVLDRSNPGLFDARTVAICPTGHRRVHYWIVQMMKWIEAMKLDVQDPQRAIMYGAFQRILGDKRRTKEQACAALTLERWLDAGGNLVALVNAGLRGEA